MDRGIEPGRPLRVLVIIPPIAKSVYGGAAIQARCTAEALNALGAQAVVVTTDRPDPAGFDVAHIVGIGDPTALANQLRACARARVPAALSPVWCSWREVSARALRAVDVLRDARSERVALRDLRAIHDAEVRTLLNRRDAREFDLFERAQAKLMRAASVLLPISAAEWRDLRLRLGVRDVPCWIVPNGIRWESVRPWSPQRRGVICAARIEPGKNQHMLAFALRDLDVELTFAGDAGNEKYLAVVRRWAGRNARFVGRLDHAELMASFSRAAVHAMPSWADVTSLSHLEAAASGARIVAGDRGFEWEYLEGDARYVDPADPESIRLAVLSALEEKARTPGDELDARLRGLTWQRAAEQAMRGYAVARAAYRGSA